MPKVCSFGLFCPLNKQDVPPGGEIDRVQGQGTSGAHHLKMYYDGVLDCYGANNLELQGQGCELVFSVTSNIAFSYL